MSGTPSAGASPASERDARDRALLGFLGVPILALLAAQFLLGMALNLYVPVGTGSAPSILSGNVVLLAHIALAALLIGGSARVVALAARLHDRHALGAGLVTLIGAVGASAAGLSFTFGGQDAGASFGMSLGFAAVLVGTMGLLARGAPTPGRAREPPRPAAPDAGGAP